VKENKWINTYPKGYISFDNIVDRPEEYNPVIASETKVGGARMWVVTDGSGDVTSFHINTTIENYVSAPFDLKAESHDVGGVATLTLTWTGTSLANKYNIYKDGVYLDETLSGDTSYDVSDPDADKWSVYYVTAANGSSESYPSNYVMGIRK